jgi:hypothetical protein
MSTPWTKACLWVLFFLAAGSIRVGAQQAGAGLADPLCGKDQLSGQYECVRSMPLSDEEVRVNTAYLASLRSLQGPDNGGKLGRIAAVRISPEYSLLRAREPEGGPCAGDGACAWAGRR